jgi:hypothetical protein
MNDNPVTEMPTKSRSYLPLILLVVVLFLTPTLLRFISAFNWQAENATVTLRNCKANCELTGIIKRSPWKRAYSITDDSGATTYISDESVLMISYPIP